MDVARVCGRFRARFWRNSSAESTIRYYRVPLDTPAFPFGHVFLHPSWDGIRNRWWEYGLQGAEFQLTPGTEALPVGIYPTGKYDKGALAVGWRPPTHWIGTLRQWQEGSTVGVDAPLVWRGEFSTACKTVVQDPNAQACATGCPVCPRISPVWVVDTPDFAGLQGCAIVKREGCEFTSQCAPAVGCPTGTAAAWQVVVDPFAGLTSGVVAIRPNGTWSTCCEGA